MTAKEISYLLNTEVIQGFDRTDFEGIIFPCPSEDFSPFHFVKGNQLYFLKKVHERTICHHLKKQIENATKEQLEEVKNHFECELRFTIPEKEQRLNLLKRYHAKYLLILNNETNETEADEREYMF